MYWQVTLHHSSVCLSSGFSVTCLHWVEKSFQECEGASLCDLKNPLPSSVRQKKMERMEDDKVKTPPVYELSCLGLLAPVTHYHLNLHTALHTWFFCTQCILHGVLSSVGACQFEFCLFVSLCACFTRHRLAILYFSLLARAGTELCLSGRD